MYFDKCQNLNEFKERYRLLSKRFHPDLGGTVELMKELNDEYDKGFYEKKCEKSIHYNWFRAEEAVEAVIFWAEDYPNFNTDFVNSLARVIEEGRRLSDNQENALKNIIKKFKINYHWEE